MCNKCFFYKSYYFKYLNFSCLKQYFIITLLICFTFVIPIAKAGVYQCVNEQGAIEFRDAPCKTSSETQEFLPISYEKSNPKNIKKQQKTFEKNIKQNKISENRQQKLKARTEKQRIKAEDKEKRRQEHCKRVKEKIIDLEDKLRQGKKLKSFNRIKAELEHCERMKLRYCGQK